jgi:hypothetical protein
VRQPCADRPAHAGAGPSASGSARGVGGYSRRIGDYTREISLLRILIGCGEKAIEAFQASDNIKDRDLLAELERVIQRSRSELAVLIAQADAEADIPNPS